MDLAAPGESVVIVRFLLHLMTVVPLVTCISIQEVCGQILHICGLLPSLLSLQELYVGIQQAAVILSTQRPVPEAVNDLPFINVDQCDPSPAWRPLSHLSIFDDGSLKDKIQQLRRAIDNIFRFGQNHYGPRLDGCDLKVWHWILDVKLTCQTIDHLLTVNSSSSE